MEIELVPIKSIRVEDRVRQDYGSLEDLAESIRKFGVLQPITIGSDMRLLAGGRRLEAASRAGMVVIPCITRTKDGEVDRLEIELQENTCRKDFTWQERAALEQRIWKFYEDRDGRNSLRKQAAATDSNPENVRRRLELAAAVEAFPALADCPTEDEAWKRLSKLKEGLVRSELVTRSQRAGLAGLKIAEKNYRVGDALAGMKALEGEKYRFAEVDPPYAIGLHKKKSRNVIGDQETEEYNELEAKDYVPFITKLAAETQRVLADGSWCIWWYGMSWHTETLKALRDAGFTVSDIPAIWYKGQGGQTASPDTMLGSCYEPFFVCRKGNSHLFKPGRSNIFDYPPVNPSRKIHPTEKPIDLLLDIYNTFTLPGFRCVVPFLGSGVSIRAAMVCDRIAFGWDLSNEHKQRFLARVAEDEDAGLYKKTA